MAVTPVIGLATQITVGGTPATAIPANPNGGYITNPLTNTDQGIITAEPLYLDPTGAAPGLLANGSVFRLEPGQTWTVIPGQSTATNVVASTTGHKFTVVYY